jgi:tryptophan synthase alpha chain
MSSRITQRFQQLKSAGRKAFIPYITAGDPDLATTERILSALAEAGADIIELGVPFSDPMADGPVIQRASERALQQPIGIAEILPLVTRFKAKYDVPVMLFTYFNPLLQCAGDQIGEALKTAGVDGVLITDLIPEEADSFVAQMRAAGIDTIFLVAPTSTDERIKLIANYASGFVYVVARTGVTGISAQMSQNVQNIVERVRKYTDLPIAVGFGISSHEHVQAVWSYADGAVVGSRLVLEIEKHLGAPDLVANIALLTRQMING